MPTVSKSIADQIIAGRFADDPPVHTIIRYINLWGGESYGLNYGPRDDYRPSPFVFSPEVYWRNPDV